MIESTKLKFGYTPARTARQSYYEDRLAATVRHKDEKEIDENTRLKMIRADTDNLIGYANVRKTRVVPVWKVLGLISKKGAIYGIDHTIELVNQLREYYSKEIGPKTEVKIIFYQTFQVKTS